MLRFGSGLLMALVLALLAASGTALAGQAADGDPMQNMSIEEMRAYQSYFYSFGLRDPLLMRFPTASEKGLSSESRGAVAPTIDQMEAALVAWLEELTESIKKQDYENALKVANEAIHTVDNEWPPLKSEHVNLIRMNEEIRNYARMAQRLKSQQDITKEFDGLRLRVDGVIWSPIDAKAVVNGRTLSAGEVMLAERKQGDLRVEMIEEHGVVFQYRGMRFRLPVELYAPPVPVRP